MTLDVNDPLNRPIEIPPRLAVVVISGGLDSSTLLHHVAAQGYEVNPISFDYGQRHNKELKFAAHQASLTEGGDLRIVDLPFARDLFADSGSSLITKEDVPEGHYAEDSMKATVVPNRNMIMTSIAIGYAVSIKADQVALGVHAGDHFIYPDCRPEFFNALNMATIYGNAGFGSAALTLNTPFINWTKNQIAARAVALGVDIKNTWSCYKGGRKHCGKCGTCVERLEALNSQEVKDVDPNFVDPTQYEDSEYWKEVLDEA